MKINIKKFDNLRKYLNDYIKNDKMFGCEILVAHKNEIIFNEAFGTTLTVENSKFSTEYPTEKNNLYLLMSLSKSFLCTIVLKFIDQGKLSFHTKISEIIPEFAQGNKKNVTVYHLLTHQGGTFPGLLPTDPFDKNDFYNLKKMTEFISSQNILFNPGEKVMYNAVGGHAILAQVIVNIDEKNRSFSKIAEEELFFPLNMYETSYGNTVNNPKRVIARYTNTMKTFASDKFSKIYNDMSNDNVEVPAAGAFSTIKDLFSFTEMLRNNGKTKNGEQFISNSLLSYAKLNHCADMINEFWDMEAKLKGLSRVPALFSLIGAYVRGNGHFITGAGYTASPNSYYSMGSGSTMWMIDPKLDITVIFLSNGFVEGLEHFERSAQINDLVLSCCEY